MFDAHPQQAFSFLDTIFEVFWINVIMHHDVGEFMSQGFASLRVMLPRGLVQRFPNLNPCRFKARYRKFGWQFAVGTRDQSKVWKSSRQANFNTPEHVWPKFRAYSEKLSPAKR